MYIRLHEAEVGAITLVIKNLENATTQKDKKKYTNQIISYLYTVKAKDMAEKRKDEVLYKISRYYNVITNDICYWFLFEKQQ